MTIGQAEARIGALESEISLLQKRVRDCDRVIGALGTDQGLLGSLENRVSSASAGAGNISTGADGGKTAFSNGAFYVGQEDGTSKTFNSLGEENDSLTSAIEAISAAIQKKLGECSANIATASKAKAEYEGSIRSYEAEISDLRAWIEEERRREEEEERRRREQERHDDGGAAEAYEEARRNKWGVFASIN